MPCPSVPIRGPLVEGRFLERPNRFLTRVALPDGSEVESHLANSGRLRDLLVPGRRVWLRPVSDPMRRTAFTTVLAEIPGGGLASLDTTLPNRLTGAALTAGFLEELAGWRLEKAEAALGSHRFDFLLRSRRGPRQMVLEVKSITLVEGGVALFPDAITDRGTRHVRRLAALARRRKTMAAILFVAQRSDVCGVCAARSIDPVFAQALAEAREAGVLVLARRCEVGLEEVRMVEAVPVIEG